MTIVFRYSESNAFNGTSCLRPMIPVVFSNGNEKIESVALLDSGADMSAIDYRIAKSIGINLEGERVKSFGVSGSIDSVIKTIDVTISKDHEKYSFSMPIRVLLTNENTHITPTLLGRKGFFEHFKITFDESSKKVSLKSNKTFCLI